MTAKMKKIPLKDRRTGKPIPKKETRQLVAHDALLMSVIRDQAGTLEKALLEAVMNSIDAKATMCRIEITERQVRIVDDGQGIQSRRAIEEYFEKFGTPHEESESKRYGRFRMGRGQLFSFGANYWQTGEFQMWVDIAKKGRAYELQSGCVPITGCVIEITLYDQLSPHGIRSVATEVGKQCRFAELDLIVNEEVVNKRASECEWTKETADAYILENDTASLYIYNQGAFVCIKGYTSYGFSGTIVSKKPLKVNFARNEVMSTCPVWRRILASLTSEAEARNREMQHKRLSDKQVEWLTNLLCDRANDHTVETKGWQTMGMIDLTDGRRLSLNSLTTLLIDETSVNGSPRLPVVFAAKGDRRADMAMQSGRCVAIATEQVGRLAGNDHLFGILVRIVENTFLDARMIRNLKAISVMSLDAVMAGVTGVFESRDWDDCDEYTQLWLGLIEQMAYRFNRYACRERQRNPVLDRMQRRTYRRIRPGFSDHALAWTDGKDNIFFDVGYVQSLELGLVDLTNVANVILHELMHDSSDMQTHQHSQEFYQDFHDLTQCVIGEMVRDAMIYLRSAKVRSRLSAKQRRSLISDSPLNLRSLTKEIAKASK